MREKPMQKEKNFYIVDKAVLPEVFIKVMEVKNILESGKEKTKGMAERKFRLVFHGTAVPGYSAENQRPFL